MIGSFVKEVSKKLNILCVLDCKTYKDDLTYFVLDFMSNDEYIYSIRFLCNDEKVFRGFEEYDIQEFPSLYQRFLIKYSTKAKYNKGRLTKDEVASTFTCLKKTRLQFEKELKESDYDDFTILKVKIIFTPRLECHVVCRTKLEGKLNKYTIPFQLKDLMRLKEILNNTTKEETTNVYKLEESCTDISFI